jgi:hypothetical protein
MHARFSSLLVAGFASAAAAQSVNIDFGTSASSPPAAYAAEGLAGTWNGIDLLLEPGASSGRLPLIGLDGAPVSATLLVEDGYGTLDYPHPETEGDVASLLDDALFALSPDIAMFLTIEGLEPGVYRVISYTWDYPTQSFGVAVSVEGSSSPGSVAGGPWTGALTVGVTHRSDVVESLDGVVHIQIVGAGPGSFFNGSGVINGLQLVRLNDLFACTADLDGSNEVDGADLGLLLGGWGTAGVGDLDGNGDVDGGDLGLLLAAWGACPTLNPARCGDVDLDSCYADHEAPGCGEPECCALVCFLDSFCCNVEWDGICVGIANLSSECSMGLSPQCGSPAAGDCFAADDSLPGCADIDCCDNVCDEDPFCCQFTWDLICVEEAELYCSRIPAGCGHPEAGDCFKGHETPFCTDLSCCETVCAQDFFCCDVQWDELCAEQAFDVCRQTS